MHVYGDLSPTAIDGLRDVMSGFEGVEVRRRAPARSSVPHPQSTDLELALKAQLLAVGFEHHVRLQHPRTGAGFEYEFWRSSDGIAIEVMGYRADDEIYKDILKFHVHEGTRVGVVLVPRYKWISSKRTDTNYAAALKALAFADRYMAVDALVVFATIGAKGVETDCGGSDFPAKSRRVHGLPGPPPRKDRGVGVSDDKVRDVPRQNSVATAYPSDFIEHS